MGKPEARGLITDFDNTLVDTKSFIVRHLTHTCQRLQIEAPSEDKILEILKNNPPFEEIFNILFNKEAFGVLTAYREDAMQTPYKAVEGALELVNSLQQKDAKIVIVSNRTNKLSERLAQASFDPDKFLAIIQPTVPKPDPKAYTEALEVLEKSGVDLKNIYILGDSLDDFSACPVNLRVNFFAVVSGPNSAEEFVSLGLTTRQILNTPQDLLEKMAWQK